MLSSSSNKKYVIIFFLAIFQFFSSSAFAFDQVSIISLIANPHKFEGKNIEVKGYLQFDGELILYVDETRAKNIDFSSAVSVQDKSTENRLVEQCANRYVVVRGTVDERYGQVKLIDVVNIYSLNSKEICWKPKG